MRETNRRSPIVIGIILAGFVMTQSVLGTSGGDRAQEPMRYYTPEVTTLEGRLALETFPGPPEYSSIKDGDKPESYWVLKLDHPISVSPRDGNSVEGLYPVEKNVQSLQLIMNFDNISPRKLGFVKGGKFRIKGKLFHRTTIHNVSRVMVEIQEANALR